MQGKWEEYLNDKVCALDIDGVLNYYPDPWLEFLNNWLDTEYKDLNEAKMTVPYQVYRNIKYEYRESGIKENLKVREGAVEFTHKLKSKGYTIIILTARPFKEHKSLFKQTTNWLDKNKIAHDGIIFGEDKHIQVLSQAPNIRFMMEDHRFYANLISQWGHKVFLMNNRYNQGELGKRVFRVKNFREVLEYGWV